MADSFEVFPPTELTYPTQRVVDGQTVSLGFRALVQTLAPTTVFAPLTTSSAEGFAVSDVSDLAATNPITIDGNGMLIDGATSIQIRSNGGVASFVFDGGQWRQLAFTRRFDDDRGVPSIYRLADLAAAAAQATNAIRPGARAFETVAQLIPNLTSTPLTLTSESYDDAAMHDNAINPSRITIPAGQGGRYYIFASCGYAFSAAGARALSIRANGVTSLSLMNSPSIAVFFGTTCSTSTVEDLAAGEYVEAVAIHSAGAPLLTFPGRDQVFLVVQRLK